MCLSQDSYSLHVPLTPAEAACGGNDRPKAPPSSYTMNLHAKWSFAIPPECVWPGGGSVSIHMDSVSAGRQGKWHFIEPCHSSGNARAPGSRVRNEPFTPCLLFQVQPASALLKVNRLKWQSWALPRSVLMERGVPVGGGAIAGCRITGCFQGGRALLQAGGEGVQCCVIQSHVMMHRALTNEDHPVPEGSCPPWVLRTPCEGVRPIYPDLVWRGNISTSLSCWTETDMLPPAEANLRRNNQRTEFI